MVEIKLKRFFFQYLPEKSVEVKIATPFWRRHLQVGEKVMLQGSFRSSGRRRNSGSIPYTYEATITKVTHYRSLDDLRQEIAGKLLPGFTPSEVVEEYKRYFLEDRGYDQAYIDRYGILVFAFRVTREYDGWKHPGL